jgi:hypothetical protein
MKHLRLVDDDDLLLLKAYWTLPQDDRKKVREVMRRSVLEVISRLYDEEMRARAR